MVLTGSVSQSQIQNAASYADVCLTRMHRCVRLNWYAGSVRWDLAAHPAVSDERVVATLTILSPSDFADEDTTNNISTTDAAINVVHPDPEPPEPVVDVTLSGVDPSKCRCHCWRNPRLRRNGHECRNRCRGAPIVTVFGQR